MGTCFMCIPNWPQWCVVTRSEFEHHFTADFQYNAKSLHCPLPMIQLLDRLSSHLSSIRWKRLMRPRQEYSSFEQEKVPARYYYYNKYDQSPLTERSALAVWLEANKTSISSTILKRNLYVYLLLSKMINALSHDYNG